MLCSYLVAGAVCTLGLDLGTSSAKAVVIDTGGQVLSQASAGYAVTSAMAGYAESEPAHWWSAVTSCAREAVHTAGAQPSAIGLSGQMHGLVMTSRQGRALRPALLWADSRATGSLRAYQLLGARALARLANPLAPGMTGPMLKWVAENEPRTYAELAGRCNLKTGYGPVSPVRSMPSPAMLRPRCSTTCRATAGTLRSSAL